MMELTQEQYTALMHRAAEVLSNFLPGEDAIAVLSRIYRQNLPGKSPRQGELMAQELVRWIGLFRGSYDAALSDPEGYVRFMLTEILKDRQPEEQTLLLQTLIRSEADTDDALSDDPDILLEQAIRQIRQCPDLPAPGEPDYDLRMRSKLYCGEDMILASTAMMLYTMAKNGELTGFPQDLTLSQAALCVCTNDSLCQLVWLEATGNLTRQRMEIVQKALKLTFRLLWLAIVLPGILSAFTVSGALAITAGSLATLAFTGAMTALVFREFDEIIACSADMIAEIPLKLALMRTMTMEAPATQVRLPENTSHTAADNHPDFLPDEDDAPNYF